MIEYAFFVPPYDIYVSGSIYLFLLVNIVHSAYKIRTGSVDTVEDSQGESSARIDSRENQETEPFRATI